MSECVTAVNIEDGITGVNFERRITAVPVLQGPPGQNGAPGGATITRIADTNLSGHRAVLARPSDEVGYPDLGVDADAELVIGVTAQAANAGTPILVQISGQMTENSWSWDLGPIYCGASGQLTQTIPDEGWLLQVGAAISATSMIINISQPVFLIE